MGAGRLSSGCEGVPTGCGVAPTKPGLGPSWLSSWGLHHQLLHLLYFLS